MQQLQQKMDNNKEKNVDLYNLEMKIKIMREHIKNQHEEEKDKQKGDII